MMSAENRLWRPKRSLIPAEGINYPFNPVVDFFSARIPLSKVVGNPGVFGVPTNGK